jgi:dimethylglycine dehydrogenase
MLLGTYERAGTPWSPVSTPWDFAQSLLPNDLERIAPSLEVGFEHFPALGEVGIRKVVNGPFTFAPDGNPLVGPIRGLSNFWVACGVMAGFSQGGGVGLALAHWMVDGDPGADIWGMDVARYGDWATLAYTNAKVRENYSRRFRIRFPNEELTAARPLRTTPIYERLQAQHAVFGDSRPRRLRPPRKLPSIARAHIATWQRSATRCAMRWDSWRSPTTASSR